MFLLMLITMCLGHSIGFHRRLIHRTFQCTRWVDRALAWAGAMVGTQGPCWVIASHDFSGWAQPQLDRHPYLQSWLVDVGAVQAHNLPWAAIPSMGAGTTITMRSRPRPDMVCIRDNSTSDSRSCACLNASGWPGMCRRLTRCHHARELPRLRRTHSPRGTPGRRDDRNSKGESRTWSQPHHKQDILSPPLPSIVRQRWGIGLTQSGSLIMRVLVTLGLMVVACLTVAVPAVAQQSSELGTVLIEFHSGRPDYEFRPDRQPENRIRINRKGEERLLAGWRSDAPEGSADEIRNALVQVAAHADGRGKFGVMFAIQRGKEFRNYSAGCGPDSFRQCEPAELGLSLDLEAGTLRLDQTLLTRETLDDGPEANEQITATGVLYFTGKPSRP